MKPLTQADVDQMLADARNPYEINPWFIALAIGGWMWAAIWLVAFVALVIA